MGRFWKILCLIVVVMAVLSGCREGSVSQPVVERVAISGWHKGTAIALTITEQAPMEAVLNYLRLQRGQGQPDLDPERVLGDVYTIEVWLSNGVMHRYRQRGDRYLSKDNHPWQKIDPERVGMLYTLFPEIG